MHATSVPGVCCYGAPAGIRTRIESLGGSSPIQLDDKRVKMEAPAWFEHATSRVEAGCSVHLSYGAAGLAEQVLAPQLAALTQQLVPGMYTELLRLSGERHARLGRRPVARRIGSGIKQLWGAGRYLALRS